VHMSEQKRGEVLRLVPQEKALVRRPNWRDIRGLGNPGVIVVALDMAGVEFVSTSFLAGCVDLAGALAEDGKALVLFRPTDHQRLLLRIVSGGSRPGVVDNEEQLIARVLSLRRQGGGVHEEGVSGTEKSMLWS